MKNLPENFTNEQHAEWVKYWDGRNRRNAIIGKIVAWFVIVVALLMTAFLLLITHTGIPGWWVLLVIGVFAYVGLSNRIDKLEKRINGDD